MRLDFSQFHPLDHRPASARCRSLPGGTRNHLHLAWVFHRREQMLAPLYRLVLCPLGRHAEQVWYRINEDGTRNVLPCCRYCRWTRLPSEADIDEGDRMPRLD